MLIKQYVHVLNLQILDDLLSIEDCGLNHVNATAQNPATVRLVYKEGGLCILLF